LNSYGPNGSNHVTITFSIILLLKLELHPIPPEQPSIFLHTGIISTTRDIKEYTDSEEEWEEWRSAVTNEREGNPGQREDIEINAHIDECLSQDESGNPSGYVFTEKIIGHLSDEKSSPSDIEIESYEEEYPDESEFFGNHWEDEVSLNLREVSEFLYRLAESETEKSATPDRDESLFGLEVDSFVLDRSLIVGKEIIDTIRDIWERISIRIITVFPKTIDRNGKYKKYERGCHEVFYIPSPDEKHNDHDGRENEDRSEIRLEDEKEYNDHEIGHIGDEAVFQIAHLWLATLEKVGKIDNESKFHKLNRLQRKRQKRYIDPPSGSIVRHSDEENEHEWEESRYENMFGIFFENRIWSLDYHSK